MRKISSAAYGFSSVKIHYSVNRINEVCFFNNFIEKNLNFIYSILWNVVTVCFTAIQLVVFGMVSVMSASCFVSSASRYQS